MSTHQDGRRFVAVIAALMIATAGLAITELAGSPGARSWVTPGEVRSACSASSVSLTPLVDLGHGTYAGYQGGLYPQGRDRPPAPYRRLGFRQARRIQPLDRRGDPSPTGEVVLMSVGMSNTNLEFATFTRDVESTPGIDPDLRLVQGAQGGWDADEISDPRAAFWTNIDGILATSGLTPRQVQVVWLKQAIGYESREFPDDARGLQKSLRDVIRIMKERYPSLRLVYLSSRTYGGYATTTLNPEPYAYESGFAVKWLIARDIRSTAIERPWIAWGPYLWTDGTAGRSDGLVWTCADVASDGTHPSRNGQRKVADLLLSFFRSERTSRGWFLD